MIIYLPKKLKPTGGTSAFARKFQAGMKKHGHQVVFNRPQKYDLLLASPRAPLYDLLYAKLQRIPILHRLDGVFYPGTSAGSLWRLHNIPLKIIRNFFADSIIYQSKFSEQSCNKHLGGPTTKPTTIIYNGVDTNLFSPHGSKANIRDNPNQHLFITTGRFRRPDQIMPILDAFQAYRQTYTTNAKLVIIGNFEGLVAYIPQKHQADLGVVFQGVIPNNELPPYLRAADVFLFTHLNPPCPNNVIEALACGLPIAGTNTGAMPELIKHSQNSQIIPNVKPSPLAQAKHTCYQNRQKYRQQLPKTQALKNMIDSYQSVIDTITK